MHQSQTLFHMSNDYRKEAKLTFGYYRTENSTATVSLNEERSAAAHRFIISLCEEQLREEIALPAHECRALPAPKAPELADAVFDEEIPF